MKKISKFISMILVMSMVLLVGCGGKEEVTTDNNVTKQETATETTAPSVETEEATETVEETTTEATTEIVLEQEASKGEDIDYLGIHEVTLGRIYSWTMNGTDGTHVADGEEAIVNAVNKAGEYARYDVGYAITELNEDGIPELVIGQTTQEGMGNMIYAIYTWKDGNFQCNVDGAEHGYLTPGAVNNAKELFLTPFANYESGTKVETNTEEVVVSMDNLPQVGVVWIEDVYLEPNGYDVFTADDDAAQRQVVFCASSKVSNFKVLALTFNGVDKEGNTVFLTKEIYGQPELRPERPLMVGMSCESSIPTYGFSYVGDNGVTRNFAIVVSGMDGAITINEF